jgi:hypothetical protein
MITILTILFIKKPIKTFKAFYIMLLIFALLYDAFIISKYLIEQKILENYKIKTHNKYETRNKTNFRKIC